MPALHLERHLLHGFKCLLVALPNQVIPQLLTSRADSILEVAKLDAQSITNGLINGANRNEVVAVNVALLPESVSAIFSLQQSTWHVMQLAEDEDVGVGQVIDACAHGI